MKSLPRTRSSFIFSCANSSSCCSRSKDASSIWGNRNMRWQLLNKIRRANYRMIRPSRTSRSKISLICCHRIISANYSKSRIVSSMAQIKTKWSPGTTYRSCWKAMELLTMRSCKRRCWKFKTTLRMKSTPSMTAAFRLIRLRQSPKIIIPTTIINKWSETACFNSRFSGS